jgi:O-antigen/teichoic acid export membrane protein
MKKDYILTFITEITILGSGLLVYRLAADILGKEGFSEYALVRRTISFLLPALILGMGVAIPRYIGYSYSNFKKANTYFIAGFIILFFVISIFSLSINLFQKNFAFLFFGDSKYYYLVFPIDIMLIGLIFHSLCYGYFRGNLSMIKANFLQLINMGIVPFLVFFLKDNLKEIILLNGLIIILVSFIFLTMILKNITFEKNEIYINLKELMAYGIQRVPGDFGLSGLFSLPSTITAHISGVTIAGYVAFGTSLLNMVGAGFAPLGLILLPKASQLVANKDFKTLKYYILKILKVTLILTILGMVFFEIFADKIITFYLENFLSDLVMIARLVVIASIGYNIYLTMRSIIDAYYVKAINTKNILISLMFFLTVSFGLILIKKDYKFLVANFVVSILFLGAMTLIEVKRLLYRYNLRSKK